MGQAWRRTEIRCRSSRRVEVAELEDLHEALFDRRNFDDRENYLGLLPSAAITDCKSLFDHGGAATQAAAGGRDREASVDLLMLQELMLQLSCLYQDYLQNLPDLLLCNIPLL